MYPFAVGTTFPLLDMCYDYEPGGGNLELIWKIALGTEMDHRK
jgi:hypothetical protein